MIYVFPDKKRAVLAKYLMVPLVFLEVLRLHPKNGMGYAWYWAMQSTMQ